MALTKITTSVVAVNSLTSANIADNSIDATKIANNQILARHIAADALSDQIADNAIGIAQLNVSDGSSGQFLKTDGSGTLSFATVDLSTKANLAGSNATAAAFTSGTGNVVASFTSTDSIGAIQLADNSGNVEIGAVGNDFHVMNAGGTAKMIVDNDGNVKIGESSKTHHGSYINLSMPNGVLVTEDTGGTSKSMTLTQNAYVDSGNEFTYMHGDEASMIQQFGGDIIFKNAAAGTSDTTITFAEKFRVAATQVSSSDEDVVRTADGVGFRSTHYANFEGQSWNSTDNNTNVRKALREAAFGSYNVTWEPGAYSNGIYYVLAGKKASTANSYIKFKVALNKATHLKITQTVSNSADATSRVTSIHYSFDDSTYTQAVSAAFGAGTETTTATLDFNSIGTQSIGGVFTGDIYVRLRLYLGSSSHETLIGWRSINLEAKAEDMQLVNAGGPGYGPVETAMFTQTSSSASNIVTNNGGYIDLAQSSHGGYMNPEIFELDNTGNYGVHIKRDGKVLVMMSQDFIDSTTSGYLASRVYRAPSNDANNRVMSYELVGHTSSTGQWMTVNNQCSFDVNAGDRVQFYIAGTAITNMDSGNWSQYTITWIDSQHSGSANRAVATYQENAHYDFIG